MDKVNKALLESPGSDPTAYAAGKDPYSRSIMPPAERRELRAAEGAVAMADYRRDQQHSRDNLAKLRTERLQRELAVSKPIGDNARKGAIKNALQLKGKAMGKTAWTKRAKTDGKFMAVKLTKKKLRSVTERRGPREPRRHTPPTAISLGHCVACGFRRV